MKSSFQGTMIENRPFWTMKSSFLGMMIKNYSKKTMKSIIVLKNDDIKSFKKDDDDDEIIISRNDDVKSSFLDDNESLFQETISFLLKQLEPARAKS